VARFGGNVAKYLGDGLIVHFGWPDAHPLYGWFTEGFETPYFKETKAPLDELKLNA
jgi:class 3 adenylate cyclase